MRTLKISVVATLASLAAWLLHFPQRIWPAHPQFTAFLLVLVICLALQFTWTDSKSGSTKGP
jgi:hypothetical protein